MYLKSIFYNFISLGITLIEELAFKFLLVVKLNVITSPWIYQQILVSILHTFPGKDIQNQVVYKLTQKTTH